MKIQHLEISTQPHEDQFSMQFNVIQKTYGIEILGVYDIVQKQWRCPLAFPNEYVALLTIDTDLSSLRTILFLLNVKQIDSSIRELEGFALQYFSKQQSHAA